MSTIDKGVGQERATDATAPIQGRDAGQVFLPDISTGPKQPEVVISEKSARSPKPLRPLSMHCVSEIQ